MKIVGLISGGKDSMYNLVKCVEHGHEIVCLANLHPAQVDTHELDSYMYQTVGHNVIDAYCECLGGVPLVRHALQGGAKDQSVEFTSQGITDAADEVSDLYYLLLKVKQYFPEVLGVSCGAIYSEYYRYRVESVCSKLGLNSLCYLWRYGDYTDLLDEMIENGMDMLLIKCACYGLMPRKHCGKRLADLRDLLVKLYKQVGVNVCGEGGEYESLTLDTPIFVKKLVVDSFDIVEVEGDVGYCVVNEWHLECKEQAAQHAVAEAAPAPKIYIPDHNATIEVSYSDLDLVDVSHGSANGIISTSVAWKGPLDAGMPRAAAACMTKLSKLLESHGANLRENATYLCVYINEMSSFEALNQVYGQFVGVKLPPSRVCVGVRSAGILMIEASAVCDASLRRSYHVYSISEKFAPACIGPYSYCGIDSSRGLIRVSGMIALVPATMYLVPNSTVEQYFDLCVEHISYVLSAVSSDITRVCRCVIYLQNEVQQVDTSFWQDRWQRIASAMPSVTHIVKVDYLPRNALVEVHVFALSNDASLLRVSPPVTPCYIALFEKKQQTDGYDDDETSSSKSGIIASTISRQSSDLAVEIVACIKAMLQSQSRLSFDVTSVSCVRIFGNDISSDIRAAIAKELPNAMIGLVPSSSSEEASDVVIEIEA